MLAVAEVVVRWWPVGSPRVEIHVSGMVEKEQRYSR